MGRVAELAVIAWLVVCALHDWRKREVPNWLTVPVVVLAWLWQCLQSAGYLPWVLAGATVLLAVLGVLPGGDMKGLVALALLDGHGRLYLAAWLGAAVVYLVWRVVRREKGMPGYVGFLAGVAVAIMAI